MYPVSRKRNVRLQPRRKTEDRAAKKRKVTIGLVAAAALILVTVKVIIPNINYNAAVSSMEDGKIIEAYEGFAALNGYKDSDTKKTELFDQYKTEKLKASVAGDVVSFGVYEQDNNSNNGKEDIEWLVLAKEDTKVLVISKYGIDCKPYNTDYKDITWENCTLRNWLNSSFLSAAFSQEEQAMILSSTVPADKNPDYNTNPGNATTDKVFLLSINEANRYFSSDEARKCAPTAYAIAQGAYTNNNFKTAGGEATCWWWVRSPGAHQVGAANVADGGSVYTDSDYVDSVNDCVRPALWINPE